MFARPVICTTSKSFTRPAAWRTDATELAETPARNPATGRRIRPESNALEAPRGTRSAIRAAERRASRDAAGRVAKTAERRARPAPVTARKAAMRSTGGRERIDRAGPGPPARRSDVARTAPPWATTVLIESKADSARVSTARRTPRSVAATTRAARPPDRSPSATAGLDDSRLSVPSGSRAPFDDLEAFDTRVTRAGLWTARSIPLSAPRADGPGGHGR